MLCCFCKQPSPVRKKILETGKGKFCSLKCRSQYASKKSKQALKKARRPCKTCGKPVTRYPSQFKNGRGQFCSRLCHGMFKTKVGKAIRTCEFCKNKFTVDKNKLKYRSARFCSNQCKWDSQKDKVREVCEICGSEFKIVPSKVGKSKYCSSGCGEQGRHEKRLDTGRRRIIYTPDFLNALLEYDSHLCGFPGCEELRSPLAGVWACCKQHWQAMGHALRERKRRRIRWLKEIG